MNKTPQSGQSLIELIIGIAIGVLFITGALGIITVTLRLDVQNKYGQVAAELAQQEIEQVASVANADWHNLDQLVHGTSTKYFLVDTAGFFTVASSTAPPSVGDPPPAPGELVTIDSKSYERYFFVEDVLRSESGAITVVSGTVDPSTLKITATVEWTDKGNTQSVVFTRYLTRSRDRGAIQKNWAGGATAGSEIPVTELASAFATSTSITYSIPGEITILNLATTTPTGPYSNIDNATTTHYAWNDVVGWIDFRITNTVYVTSTMVTGFALSNAVGYVALNCNSVPPNATLDVCPPNGPSQFGVLNDGSGNLSGEGWNDNLGWISFKDALNPTPGYQVTVDQNTGDMHGFAWSETAGWISFNCADTLAGCTPSNYKVKVNAGAPVEGTLISRVYTTEREEGAAPNAIIWQGSQPVGTRVRFLIATDCLPGQGTPPSCVGGFDGWNFIGPTGDTTIYYEANANAPVAISRSLHNNKKYLRYKAFLYSDSDRIVTPTVNTITINWSR